MKSFSPNFSFIGEREYVNGASIYDEILKNIGSTGFPVSPCSFQLTIRNFPKTQLRIHCFEPNDAINIPPEAVADYTLSTKTESIVGWLEKTGKPISNREPYDQSAMDKLGSLKGDRMIISGAGEFSPIQVVSTTARRLHDALFPPQDDHKWLLVKLKLPHPVLPSDTNGLEIEIIRNLNNLLTVSALTKSGTEIGKIGFSLAKQ